MELQVKTVHPDTQETQFKIKAKSLSYKLSPAKFDDYILSWFFSEDANRKADGYILKNVDCEAKPGEMTAIAGPSGAGKTTLLEILAGVIPQSKVTGHVLVNNQPMSAAHFRRLSGYVTQDDALFPLLTVEEMLVSTARLRLRGGLAEATERVRELLKELGLDHVAGVRIGSESTRGISGGEKRRVSVGIALVHDPAVLLIDEPTSGLDSAAALHVMGLLKSLAKNQGKTVVLTIHQPGFRILELFDQVVLLSKGIVLHHGSLSLLEERLKLAGYSIPRQVNVLEFAIDVTESLLAGIEETEVIISEARDEHEQTRKLANLVHVDRGRVFYANSPLKEVMILSKRFSYNVFRTKQLFAAKLLQAVLVGITLGTVFMNASNDHNKAKLQTQVGFFAFSLTFLLSSTTEVLPIFLQERRILMRETSSGAYRIGSYTIATTLVFLPFLLLVALLYATPVYWLVGLRRDIDGFLYFSLVVWGVVLVSNSFVACFSALVPNFIMGMSVIAGLMGAFFLFSGYFLSKDDIPKYWLFVHYMSLFKYPFECLIINEFGGQKGNWRCVEKTEGACILYGEEFLKQQNLKESQKWSNLLVMLTFIVGYRILSFLILRYRSSRSRS